MCRRLRRSTLLLPWNSHVSPVLLILPSSLAEMGKPEVQGRIRRPIYVENRSSFRHVVAASGVTMVALCLARLFFARGATRRRVRRFSRLRLRRVPPHDCGSIASPTDTNCIHVAYNTMTGRSSTHNLCHVPIETSGRRVRALSCGSVAVVNFFPLSRRSCWKKEGVVETERLISMAKY